MARTKGATFERIARTPLPEIDLSKMDKAQKRGFLDHTLDALERFYSDPANLARFQEWEKEYDKRIMGVSL